MPMDMSLFKSKEMNFNHNAFSIIYVTLIDMINISALEQIESVMIES